MQVYDRKDRLRLVKESTRALRSSGWRVEDVNAKSFDYSGTKDAISFMVECVDASVLNYKGLPRVVDYLEGTSATFNHFGVPSICILDEGFHSCDFRYLLSRGILAVFLPNIAMLDRLSDLPNQLPGDLSPFEELFARRSFALATAFSENSKSAGRVEDAIAWARKAAVNNPRAVGAQQRWIMLLRDQGNIAEAAAACRDALRINRNATGLIRLMQELAKDLGDQEELSYWLEFQDERSRDGSAADFLLSRRLPTAPKTQASLAQPGRASEATKALLGKFVSRFRNSGTGS